VESSLIPVEPAHVGSPAIFVIERSSQKDANRWGGPPVGIESNHVRTGFLETEFEWPVQGGSVSGKGQLGGRHGADASLEAMR